MKTKLEHKWFYLSLVLIGIALDVSAVFCRTERLVGLLSGLGAFFLVLGGVRLFRIRRLSQDPDRLREYEVSLTDERNLFLRNKAITWTFWISIYTELAAGLVLAYAFSDPAIRTIGTAICFFICAQLLLYCVLWRVFSKKF